MSSAKIYFNFRLASHTYRNFFILLIAFLIPAIALTQSPEKKHWYDKLSLRGYTQLRYSGLLNSNEDLGCEQCDRGWSKTAGLGFRRARIVLMGQVHKRVSVYIQFDMANLVSGTQHYLQVRDLYTDINLDTLGRFRIRAGQSKVPFGFENMQSSSNRLPLDRSDGINSGVPNEREVGLFLYWAPDAIRQRFAMLTKEGLKGSGDYGVFGIGIYNGQTTNKPELNGEPHAVVRLSYPFAIGAKQILEAGVQAYSGKFVVSNLSSGTGAAEDYLDRRVAASVSLYPQPIGFQAEVMTGTSPRFDTEQDSILQSGCVGGYAMLIFRKEIKNMVFIPYVRSQYYDGGKKHELDARSYTVIEHEAGIEWEPIPAFEITAAFVLSDRRYEDFAKQDNHQTGHLVRLQLQFNY